MAGSYSNNKDSIEISELASLNEDISDDMIEQLQQQLSQNITSTSESKSSPNVNDDSTLFEEVTSSDSGTTPKDQVSEIAAEEKTETTSAAASINLDDDFTRKYKAKLKNNQNQKGLDESDSSNAEQQDDNASNNENGENKESIETLSQGNISERPITPQIKEYNDSLNFLDGNVKYSKYVMYIDPENVDFIESLTVKERKNLINSILRQQDDIANTKRRFRKIQNTINQIIIVVLTLAISIPLVYYVINASLEATINNHRNAQTNWQTLYKEHGKITQN